MERRRFLQWAAGTTGAVAGLGTETAGALTRDGGGEARAEIVVAQKWPNIVAVKQLPVGQSMSFTFGAGSKWQGRSGAVYRQSTSVFKVFDLVCTHMGCTAVPIGAEAFCPCHHSVFSLETGAALSGPAQSFQTGPLSAVKVTVKNGLLRWVGDH
jgi:nitrite reductase/ring-hydroxylating ferredoxin subunit